MYPRQGFTIFSRVRTFQFGLYMSFPSYLIVLAAVPGLPMGMLSWLGGQGTLHFSAEPPVSWGQGDFCGGSLHLHQGQQRRPCIFTKKENFIIIK